MMMLQIDTRESKLIKVLQDKGVDINVIQLDIGDIHIKNEHSCIVIERKTIVDALASINDGRYREQKARLMSMEGVIPMYIIENDVLISDNKTLSGMYINTMFRDRIPIHFTNGVEETANTIIHIFKKLEDKPDRFCKTSSMLSSASQYLSCIKAKTKKIDNIDKKTCFILQLSQIPMISTKIANEIANKHNNMKEFIHCLDEWENPIQYLMSIDGIGKNKAETIINYLL